MSKGHGEHPLLSRGYTRWLIFVLLMVSLINFADRAILSVLAQAIKEDLHLTDTDLGVIQGLGFAILYSVLGIPIGLMAERVNRKGLIAICVGAWSIMTVACGFAGSFTTLLLGRIGVGIGEAGFQPVTVSLMSDHFKANRRASVIAVIMLGSPLGFLVGQSVGGWVASVWDWRMAFYIMGVPGVIAALLVWLTLREPPRGLAEGQITTTAAPSLMAVLRKLWATPAFRHLLLGVTISSFAMNAVAQFVLPFYLRSFDLSLAMVGVIFGIVAFTSNGLGMLLGGFGFDWLSRRDVRWPVWGPALALCVAGPCYFGAFVSMNVWVSLAFVWLGNFSLVTYIAPSMATGQNLVGPRMRATTSAIVAMSIGLFGAGLGPTALGAISDFFARRLFEGANFITACPGGRAPVGADAALDAACQAAATQGLRYALVSVLVVFFWGAVHYLLASRTLQQDLYVPDAVEPAQPSDIEPLPSRPATTV